MEKKKTIQRQKHQEVENPAIQINIKGWKNFQKQHKRAGKIF